MSREEGRNGVTWMGSQTLLLKQVLETFRIVWERLLNVCGLGLLDRLRWRRGGVLDSFGGTVIGTAWAHPTGPKVPFAAFPSTSHALRLPYHLHIV